MQGTGHLVFFWIAGHFKLCRHGKDSLCTQNSFEAMWQPFLGRCVEPVIEIIRNRQPPVMKNCEFLSRRIPQGAGIARHAFANPRPEPGCRSVQHRHLLHQCQATTRPSRQTGGGGRCHRKYFGCRKEPYRKKAAVRSWRAASKAMIICIVHRGGQRMGTGRAGGR